MRDSVKLEPLTAADVETIRRWPRYPAWAARLDYALRPGGWLEQFPESSANRRFAARAGTELVGFSLLTGIANGDAEFYIALHPDHLGRGVGRAVTVQTVAFGFDQLCLRRIHLKVRDWHERGIHLYESVGFRRCGAEVADIQGQPINFVVMEILRAPSK